MAIPFSGNTKSAVTSGLISKIEVRQQGTGSFVSVGHFRNANLSAEPITRPGDPAGTEYVQSIRYSFSFDIMQTATNVEIAALAGTAGTGLYETDMEVKFTYKTGRTVTLGAVSGAPLRIKAGYKNDTDLQVIPCTGQITEPFTTLAAKVG